MANVTRTYTFVNGQPADATQVNKDFDDIIAGVGDISAAGHELINDANAAAQLVTLGTAAYSEGTWTPVLHDFTIVGSAPAVTGKWKRIGNIVSVTCVINAGTGGNTSVACTGGGTSTIGGLPVNSSGGGEPCIFTDGYATRNLGIGNVATATLQPPTITAVINSFTVMATYFA